MTRDKAYNLMCEMIKSPNLRKHGLAVEAIMRGLCKDLKQKYLNGQIKIVMDNSVDKTQLTDEGMSELSKKEFDEEEWAIVGLLHDADYELIEKDPSRHTLVTEEKLREAGEVNERIINGIKAHHEGVKPTRDNLLEKAVYAADELSGLITAVALVRPDKKLSSVTVESVMKKFPQKEFAKGAKREQIETGAKELEMPLEEFVALALRSMQQIAQQLGL